MKLELDTNQSAMVLSIDENGEITVDVATEDEYSVTAHVCTAIASKLLQDTAFQTEIMNSIDLME